MTTGTGWLFHSSFFSFGFFSFLLGGSLLRGRLGGGSGGEFLDFALRGGELPLHLLQLSSQRVLLLRQGIEVRGSGAAKVSLEETAGIREREREKERERDKISNMRVGEGKKTKNKNKLILVITPA